MAGLSSLLYVGASGLSASQHGVQTASDNIANVDTPGFHRRESIQSTRQTYTLGGLTQGAGVKVDGTKRFVDEALEQRLRDAKMDSGYAEARADVLRQAEVIFGDLDGFGMSNALDGLFSSFDRLAREPQDGGARQQVLDSAQQFVDDVSRVSDQIIDLQGELDVRIEDQVERINTLSGEIAQLNLQIGGLSDPPPDLLDKRDEVVSELGSLVGINVVQSEQRLAVSLQGSGFSLVVDGVTQKLSSSTTSGAAVITGDKNGIPLDVTTSITGGALTGTVEARNVDLQATADQVDQFVFDFANAINAVHAGGYGTDGVNGRNLFAVSATASGAAGTLELDAAVDGQPDLVAAATDPLLVPGDNRNALALAELRDVALAGGQTPGDTLRSVLSDFGSRLSIATTSAEARTAVEVHLEDMRSSVSGVNLDEEMTLLLQYRQSYAAAARVIQTADELMQEVVALKR